MPLVRSARRVHNVCLTSQSLCEADMRPARARTAASSRVRVPDRRAPPARQRHERSARRETILDAALTEFAARGFAAARLDDIAHRAGVAKGTLYLSFRDKETL